MTAKTFRLEGGYLLPMPEDHNKCLISVSSNSCLVFHRIYEHANAIAYAAELAR